MILKKEEIDHVRKTGPDAPYPGGSGIYGDVAREILNSHEEMRKMAVGGWESARQAAIYADMPATERAADAALEKLRA
jgi:hypothetical protein